MRPHSTCFLSVYSANAEKMPVKKGGKKINILNWREDLYRAGTIAGGAKTCIEIERE